MEEPRMNAEEEGLRRRTRSIAQLLGSWRLAPADWYLADESVLLLQSYPVLPREQDAQRAIVHVDADKLPFRSVDAERIIPPPDSAEGVALARFVEAGAIALELVPAARHAVPVTFKKMIELGDQPVWLASLRALGKIWLHEMADAADREGGRAPAEAAWLQARIARLEALAQVAWPSRDRWFGKFCSELAALVATFGEEHGAHAARLNRLGRRHALT
jgi:hypothetical protein